MIVYEPSSGSIDCDKKGRTILASQPAGQQKMEA